jgi:hypothetical protein
VPSDCVTQPVDYSQPAGRAALGVHDVPVFPPVADPYGSLTPAELAAFGIGLAHISSDDDDEAQTDDDEVTEDDEYPASLHSAFPFSLS